MRLDRNINKDVRGKYALIKLRKLKAGLSKLRLVWKNDCLGDEALDFGDTPDTEFFVIRLKDKYAAPALAAYAMAAYADDPEYAKEVLDLAMAAALHPLKKKPD